jgi:hypothetical protein
MESKIQVLSSFQVPAYKRSPHPNRASSGISNMPNWNGCHSKKLDEFSMEYFTQRLSQAICWHLRAGNMFDGQTAFRHLVNDPFVTNINGSRPSCVVPVHHDREGIRAVGKHNLWCRLSSPKLTQHSRNPLGTHASGRKVNEFSLCRRRCHDCCFLVFQKSGPPARTTTWAPVE